MKLACAMMLWIAAAQVACGRVYHVRNQQDLEAINGTSLRPGDRIVLQGGATLPGPLMLGPDDSGRAWRPIVVESDSGVPAVIDAGAGSAILIDAGRWVILRNINLIGAGRKSGNRQGVGVRIRNSSHVRVDRVEASGFQRAGVEIHASRDVRITRVFAHDNGYAGICSGNGRSRDLYLGHCRAINNPGDPTLLNNHSGNGIVLMDVERAMVEHCEAAGNGWDMPRQGNGPVGIWCAFADRVVIQHCVSHHNQSPGLDGGGFDFDGGVTHSVMQYNLSHHNKGYGYLLYEYGSGMTYGNNTIRYCTSEDDGEGGIGIGVSESAPPGTTLGRCVIRHNIIRTKPGKPAIHIFEGEAPGVVITGNASEHR